MNRFTIKRIMSRQEDSGFTVAKVEFLEHAEGKMPTREPVVVGRFVSVFVGDDFESEGAWESHPIFGYRFNVKNPRKVLPEAKKGLAEFIRRHAEGVGLTVAKRIVETFGDAALDVAVKQPDRLLEVKGVTDKKAVSISESLKRHIEFDSVAYFILTCKGNLDQAIWLYGQYGDETIRKFKENPYLLMEKKDCDFRTVEKMAGEMGFQPDHPFRIRQAIVSFMQEKVDDRGDLYIPKREVEHGIYPFLTKSPFPVVLDQVTLLKLVKKEIESLVASGRIVVEENDQEEECLYLKQYHSMEEVMVRRIKSLVEERREQLVPKPIIRAWIEKQEQKNGVRFAPEQKGAVEMALTEGVSVLTGGPGTGKTHTVKAILDCLIAHRKGADIELLAPTGKASKRMEEMTGRGASTIHSALGIGNEVVEPEELEADLVVVDESSMADIFITYRLLTALSPKTSVLFVGDVEQLPSVGPGLILRDFIESDRIPTTRLKRIFRQAQDSQIVMNAHALIAGKTTKDFDGIRWDDKVGDFHFLETKDRSHEAVVNLIVRSVDRLLKTGRKLEEIQILAPMKKGELGVWRLNQLIQSRFNSPSPKKNEVEHPLDPGCVFREGDRVIHTVNNRDLDVMNGEVGEIKLISRHIDRGTEVEVEYDDEKVVTYTLEELEELDLAYAMTVHKSQGSEYPVIIMPFHPSADRMLNRNLVYTAWTRAKDIVINIGNIESLDRSAVQVEQMNRNSMIGRKLRQKINNFNRFAVGD